MSKMASFGSGRDGFKVVRKPAGVDDRAALDAFGAMTTTAKAPSAGATAEVEKGAGCVDATSKVSDRQPGSSCVRVDPQTNCWHRPGVRVSSQTCEQTRGGCNEFCVREKLLVVVPIEHVHGEFGERPQGLHRREQARRRRRRSGFLRRCWSGHYHHGERSWRRRTAGGRERCGLSCRREIVKHYGSSGR